MWSFRQAPFELFLEDIPKRVLLDMSFVPERTALQMWSNAMFFTLPGNCQVKARHIEMDFRLYLSSCLFSWRCLHIVITKELFLHMSRGLFMTCSSENKTLLLSWEASGSYDWLGQMVLQVPSNLLFYDMLQVAQIFICYSSGIGYCINWLRRVAWDFCQTCTVLISTCLLDHYVEKEHLFY